MREAVRAAGWGGVAHVFVAVAVAVPPVAGAGVALASALGSGQGPAARALLLALGVAFLAAVVAVSLLPVVRPAEVALARTLLDVDLPDVPAPSAWDSRRRGALWLLVLLGVGLVVAVALLALLPLAIGLLAHPLSGDATLTWLGLRVTTGSGWGAAWTVVPGVLLQLLALGVLPGGAVALRRWAPPVLGPTLAERVAATAQRELDLARANALAREVHDTLGHRLTAMTVQATVARRLLGDSADGVTADRLAAADRALAAVEDLGRRAQQEVDDVVGALRDAGRTDPVDPVDPAQDPAQDVVPLVRRLLADQPLGTEAVLPDRLLLAPSTARAVHRVLREALTNAARHGTGPATLRLACAGDALVVDVENPVAPPGDPASERRPAGLRGLREHALLVGGELEAGPVATGAWRVRLRVPT